MSWRVCSSCKTPIEFRSTYWVCSVSTCTHKRTGLYFCSVPCWEVHLPSMRHREAWAVEKRAPSPEEWERQQSEDDERVRPREIRASDPVEDRARKTISPTKNHAGEELPRDVLIVVSKLKKYIRMRSGLSTSDNVMTVLSDELRRICDRASRIAEEQGRKTVLDRDIRDALKPR